MLRRTLTRRIRARLRGERGFTIVETVVALGVIFASLSVVAYTVTTGLNYIAYSRERIQATGFANEVIEQIRSLPFSNIKRGLNASELPTDPNIVLCSGTYRFETCGGDAIVSSTYAGGSSVEWLVPHTGTQDLESLQVDWSTYVTNEDVASEAYTVTVLVSWQGTGALPNASGNVVRVQSKFWSPTGCVSSALHPFAAPCQPFFYGLAEVPQAKFTVTGDLHQGFVSFTNATVSLGGASATGQQEQLSNLAASVDASAVSLNGTSGGGTTLAAGADDDSSSADGSTGGGTLGANSASMSALNTDCCNEMGIRLTVPSGDLGGVGVSTQAKATDPYACPPDGTAETDSMACAGARFRQGGAITAELPFTHVVSGLGPANLLRVAAPAATYTTAVAERDAVTGYDGLMDVRASRTFGTIQIGGFPTSGMTAPTGMSTTATNDTNYCLRISGFTSNASLFVGPRTATNPSASVAGTLFYYNGAGYSSKTLTDATLSTLSVNCSSTQTVSGKTVTWQVSVAAGGITPGSTTTSQTTDPGDAQTRSEAVATTTPPSLTVRYVLTVNGVIEDDLTLTTAFGSLRAQGVYGEPPTAGAG